MRTCRCMRLLWQLWTYGLSSTAVPWHSAVSEPAFPGRGSGAAFFALRQVFNFPIANWGLPARNASDAVHVTQHLVLVNANITKCGVARASRALKTRTSNGLEASSLFGDHFSACGGGSGYPPAVHHHFMRQL